MPNFEVSEQPSQPVLIVAGRTAVGSLPALIGQSYMKIVEYLSDIGESAAGPPFTAYHNLDMQDLEVEMGFPVSRPLQGRGDILAGELPQCKVVATMYKGPYAGMEHTYNELFQWIAANGHEPTGVCYEHYLNAPDQVPESELLTRIVIPLK